MGAAMFYLLRCLCLCLYLLFHFTVPVGSMSKCPDYPFDCQPPRWQQHVLTDVAYILQKMEKIDKALEANITRTFSLMWSYDALPGYPEVHPHFARAKKTYEALQQAIAEEQLQRRMMEEPIMSSRDALLEEGLHGDGNLLRWVTEVEAKYGSFVRHASRAHFMPLMETQALIIGAAREAAREVWDKPANRAPCLSYGFLSCTPKLLSGLTGTETYMNDLVGLRKWADQLAQDYRLVAGYYITTVAKSHAEIVKWKDHLERDMRHKEETKVVEGLGPSATAPDDRMVQYNDLIWGPDEKRYKPIQVVDCIGHLVRAGVQEQAVMRTD
ncbi:hypothetical protein NX059_012413 [Plenodomus lindquistii]|nr:hypothetical protein NX059_012413 [Plenodomus lindquistii]